MDDAGVSRDTEFQGIRQGAGFETGDSLKESWGGDRRTTRRRSSPSWSTRLVTGIFVRTVKCCFQVSSFGSLHVTDRPPISLPDDLFSYTSTFQQLLDKPWSQVSPLCPPDSCL